MSDYRSEAWADLSPQEVYNMGWQDGNGRRDRYGAAGKTDPGALGEGSPEPIEGPPLRIHNATIQGMNESGLRAALDADLPARYRGSARNDLLNRMVLAVSGWRDSFRDCGCWKKGDGFALCPWHERLFRPQREEAERLAASMAHACPACGSVHVPRSGGRDDG